ncbi:MAG: hypothetical protein JWM12_2474 [Ilumatobacteraceae bacterium]|nr:hypothetical protein [Ilumatobacteraceae bacterium]
MSAARDPLAVLQRVRNAPPRPRPGERCEMCNERIPDEHEHVVNIEVRSLMCTCRGCWMLFTVDGSGGGRFRAVPDRYASVDDFTMSSEAWGTFQIPVSVAFFFRNSSTDKVSAFYPSPAGATESLLELGAWDDLVAANPILATLSSDVEALLVRSGETSHEGFVVPIDACYELVGHMRMLWRGFDGGREANDALERFFVELRARCR